MVLVKKENIIKLSKESEKGIKQLKKDTKHLFVWLKKRKKKVKK